MSILIEEVSGSANTAHANQRKCFFAVGRYWIFYSDDTNIVWRTSTDGVNWSNKNTFEEGSDGTVFSCAVVENKIHVVYLASDGSKIYYRRGTLQSNGSINWDNSLQTAVPSGTYTYLKPTIWVDSGGYPWIGYSEVHGSGQFYPRVTKASTNDGSWTTDSGFPYTLEEVLQGWTVTGVALTNSKVYVIWTDADTPAYGKLWNGTSWGSKETITQIHVGICFGVSITAINDDVFLVYGTREIPSRLLYKKRTYQTGEWSAEYIIQRLYASEDGWNQFPTITADSDGSQVIVCWLNAETDDKTVNYRIIKTYLFKRSIVTTENKVPYNNSLTASLVAMNREIPVLYMTPNTNKEVRFLKIKYYDWTEIRNTSGYGERIVFFAPRALNEYGEHEIHESLSSEGHFILQKATGYYFSDRFFSLMAKNIGIVNKLIENISNLRTFKINKFVTLTKIYSKIYRFFRIKYLLYSVASHIQRMLVSVKAGVTNLISLKYKISKIIRNILSSFYRSLNSKDTILIFGFKILISIERIMASLYLIKSFTTKFLSIIQNLQVTKSRAVKFLYSLVNLKMKSLVLKHSIKILLVCLLRNIYNLKEQISKFLFSKFSLRQLTNNTLISIFKIFKRIGKGLSFKWSLRSILSNILKNVHNLLEPKNKIVIFSYVSKQLISKSIRKVWKIFVSLSKTFTILYYLKSKVTRIISFVYSIRSLIEKFFTILYNILTLTLISKLFIFKFNIKQLKIKIFNSIYKLLDLRSVIFISKYSLRSVISNSFRSIFSIIGRLFGSLKVSYTVGLFIIKILQISHSIIGQVFSSIKILQNVFLYSVNLFSQKYGVKSLKEKIFSSINNLSCLVIKEFRILHDIIFKQILSSSLKILHSLRSLAFKSIISSFKISQILQRIISTLHDIPGLVARELISSFKNLVIKLRILTFKFKLKENIEGIISSLYSSIGIVSNILKIGYEVISGIYEILITLIRIRPNISLIRKKTIVTLIKEKAIQILKKIIRRVKK